MSISILIKPASSNCNLNCKYCFYKDVSDNRTSYSKGMMSLNTADNIIKKAFTPSNKIINFSFQGGEPTLIGLSFYNYFISAVKKYNIYNSDVRFSLQTNGYSLDESWAKFFKENNFLLGISLDGPKSINDELRTTNDFKGSYNKVIQSISLLKKYDVPFNILCVLTAFNSKHITKVYNFFKKQGLNYLQFIPCIEPFHKSNCNNKYSLNNNQYTQALNILFDSYKADYFNGNYTSIRLFDNYIQMLLGNPPESCDIAGICNCYFVVESNGDTYPCDFYCLDEHNLGNINDMSFEEMKKIDIGLNFINESKNIDCKCLKCKHFSLCRGGCKRYRTLEYTHNVPFNYFCETYFNFFERNIPSLIEIAKSCYNNSLLNNTLK